MNGLLCLVIKILEPCIIKGHLHVSGQDKYFGLFLMLGVIMLLLLFLGLLDLIEQVSKSIH